MDKILERHIEYKNHEFEDHKIINLNEDEHTIVKMCLTQNLIDMYRSLEEGKRGDPDNDNMLRLEQKLVISVANKILDENFISRFRKEIKKIDKEIKDA